MNPSLTPLFTWMVLELILTAALAAVYLGLRQVAKTAADRYLFLKLAFAVIVLLPLIPAFAPLTLWPSAVRTVSAASSGLAGIQVRASGGTPWPHVVTEALYAVAVSYGIAVGFNLIRIFASSVKLKTLAEAATPLATSHGIPILGTDAPVPPATFG